MKIQILVDNPESWMIPYAHFITARLNERGNEASLILSSSEIVCGDLLLLLSCEKILNKQYLSFNKHNLVIHASDLPRGRGWSPWAWEVLAGANEISLSIIEAVELVDSGVIYEKTQIQLDGTELVEELREKIAHQMLQMILTFTEKFPNVPGEVQVGDPTYYPRRTITDSEIDIHKSVAEQFNLFRIVDNQRYPAYFMIGTQKYVLKITKA